jgi:hypothetical protein
MASFGAVLDTCVLFPMPLADTLLLAAADCAYTFHWTDDLLRELERVMLRTGRTPQQATERVSQMRKIFAESQVTGYRQLIRALTLPDSADRHVLAAPSGPRSSVSSPSISTTSPRGRCRNTTSRPCTRTSSCSI